MTKTTKTPATKATATNTVKVAKKPAVNTTAPAVKVITPVVKATKVITPVVKAEKARKARISKADSAWINLSNMIFELVAKDSKSSVGQFIIKLFKETKSDITGEVLAKAFVASFKTKTGITPDEKWARRNVKLFIDKGILKCKIEEKAE